MKISKKPYGQLTDGDWVRPVRRGYRLACCDCGLVHIYNFKLVRDGKKRRIIFFQVKRDDRAAGQLRRHHRTTLKCKPVGKGAK